MKEVFLNNCLESERLLLLPVNIQILKVSLMGDEALGEFLSVEIDSEWTAFGREALQYVLEKLEADSNQQSWWTYLPILKSDNKIIGSGGYKGPPAEGLVEIGYEIAPSFRKQGYATEMAQKLVQHAFSFSNIEIVQAHTLGKPNASTQILNKLGFKKTNTFFEESDEPIWQWRLNR